MNPAYSGKKWLCTAAIGLLVANVAGVSWQKSAAQNHAYAEAAIQPDCLSVPFGARHPLPRHHSRCDPCQMPMASAVQAGTETENTLHR